MLTVEELKTSGRLAVLYGGTSAERSVSLESGSAVATCLKEAGFCVDQLDLSENVVEQIQQANPDFCFIALHGGYGENGTIQALLDLMGIPYTGSGMQGSAVAMDKLRSKQIWQSQGLSTPAFVALSAGDDFDAVSLLNELGGKVFVKPSTEGSSVGMGMASDAESLTAAISDASAFAPTVLVEQYVSGPEYTVAILEGRQMPSIAISTDRNFYDFHAKYEDDATRFDVPSGLSDEDEQEIQALAKRAFASVGCRGWGRVDVMRDEKSGEFYLLEVNTVPGMTSHSLVPMAAKAAGMSFSELVVEIISLGLVK